MEARMKVTALRAVILSSAVLVLAGCAHKPSAGERQKRYDDLCLAVERAEAKQADLQREAASYGRPKSDAEYNERHAAEKKQGEVVQQLRKERDEAKAALDAP
jgi:outer membrane murein-binding lipoprotein Lpp